MKTVLRSKKSRKEFFKRLFLIFIKYYERHKREEGEEFLTEKNLDTFVSAYANLAMKGK